MCAFPDLFALAAGEVKIIALLVLSATLLGESKEFTLKMTLGCALTFGRTRLAAALPAAQADSVGPRRRMQ